MANFYQHTQSWIDGELLEGALVCIFGLATIIVAFLFYKLGGSPTAKALLYPLLVSGVIYTAVGISLRSSNGQRKIQYEEVYKQDADAFVESERARVESFQYQYVISKVVAIVCFIATLLIFWFSTSITWQAVGIGLSYFGLVGLIIDYFSQHRAIQYYEAILSYLNS